MAFIRRCLPILNKSVKLVPLVKQEQNIHRWVAPTLVEFKRREKKQGGKITHPRNTFLEWNLEAELFAFGKRLGEDFDSNLLLQVFTDRSFVIKEEMKQKEMEFAVNMKDNRELSDEGMKFMEEYVQLYLEAVLPKFPKEGIISVKNHLLSENVLANISLHLGTKDIILAAEYPADNYILANTFKALVGALHQSSGDDRTAIFVRDFVITQLQGQDINELWHIKDPWQMLVELINKTGASIEPRLIGEVGMGTLLACYRVGIYIDKNMLSTGFGESISVAKEMAAREALKKLFGTEENMCPINFKLQSIPKDNSRSQQQIASR